MVFSVLRCCCCLDCVEQISTEHFEAMICCLYCGTECFCSHHPSKNERKQFSQTSGDYGAGYGELTPNSFRQLMDAVELGSDDTFVDLGSGAGKLVLQAALTFGVARAIGVELGEVRHEIATTRGKMTGCNSITFIHGDMLAGECVDKWANASVIYIAVLLFSDSFCERLCQACIIPCSTLTYPESESP